MNNDIQHLSSLLQVEHSTVSSIQKKENNNPSAASKWRKLPRNFP